MLAVTTSRSCPTELNSSDTALTPLLTCQAGARPAVLSTAGGLFLASLADRADLERRREIGIEALLVVTSERYDDGDAGFEGRDYPPVFYERLAAVVRVAGSFLGE